MLSRLGEGERSCDDGADPAKNGEAVVVVAARDGDSIGGLLLGFDEASGFIQGFEYRLSDTADSTGDGAVVGAAGGASSLPSA